MKYDRAKIRLDAQWNDTYYFQKLQEGIIKTKINIVKYNYAMD